MKTLKLMLALVAMMMIAVACGPKSTAPKVLVLYYSQTSNTKTVAQEIATRLNADIEEILAVQPYDGDFQATIDRCMKADLSKYDVIFLGYPVWFGTYAPPMAAFLAKADLSGKKVVPFCTFGSGGLESSVKDLKEKQPNAEVLPGYGVRAARMAAVANEIDQFLKAGGFIEGEYTKLEPFSEQQPVSEEQAAIFNASVGDYPMIQAEAKTVGSRPIPGGTEFLFTAVDKPRPDGQQAAPAGEMKVYVTVLEGETPVFTQVVR